MESGVRIDHPAVARPPLPHQVYITKIIVRRIQKLPGLRSLSDMQFGGFVALFIVLGFALFFAFTERRYTSNPSPELLVALAGVGGTMFVAYSVTAASLVRGLRTRSRGVEYLLGGLIGMAMCGAVGIGFALILLKDPTPLNWFRRFMFCWSGIALIFLALLVAFSPLWAYEDARSSNSDPDE